jgi:hypothetical protein
VKIAYICDEDLSHYSGVYQKIMNQIGIWRANGHEVLLMSLRSTLFSSAENKEFINKKASISAFEKIFRHYKNASAVIPKLIDFKPDLIYTRYIKYSPRFANKLSSLGPYIIEVNTNDSTEFGLKNYWYGVYNRLTRSNFIKNASGIVTVTNELKNDRSFSIFKVPTVVIANGYPCSQIKIKTLGRLASQRPQLVFVGSSKMPWHGLDKIYTMAESLSDFDFNIIGPSNNDIYLNRNRLNNIISHGYIPENQVDDLLTVCDIGISTLALHRNDMHEACPLKSRQYLAHGLPIIIGYIDTDFNEQSDFILSIGNSEDNVKNSIEEIRSFVLTSRNINKQNIRDYAKLHLDDVKKEGARLKFFELIHKTSKIK